MRSWWSVVALAASLAACHHRPKTPAEIEAEADRKAWNDPAFCALAKLYEDELVWPYCGDRASPPGTQIWVHGAASGRQACGLLANAFDEPRAGSELGDRCVASGEDECVELVLNAFRARLSERYPLADKAWVTNHCAGYPDDCATLTQMELRWLKSHNLAAAWKFEQNVKRLDDERAYAVQQRRERRRSRALLGTAIGLMLRSSKK